MIQYPPQDAVFARAQQFMSPSPAPSISTGLLSTADGELNRELSHFLFDPPTNPDLPRMIGALVKQLVAA